MANSHVDYLQNLALESAVFTSEMNYKIATTDWSAIESCGGSRAFSDEDDLGIFSDFNSYSTATESYSLSAAMEGVGEMLKKGLKAVGDLLKKIGTAIMDFFKTLPEKVKALFSKIKGGKNSFSDADNARDNLKKADKLGNTEELEKKKAEAQKNLDEAKAKLAKKADDSKAKSDIEKYSKQIEDIDKEIADKPKAVSDAKVGALKQVAANYAKALTICYNNGYALLNVVDTKIGQMPDILKTIADYKAPESEDKDYHEDTTIGTKALSKLTSIEDEIDKKSQALDKDEKNRDDIKEQFEAVANKVTPIERLKALQNANSSIKLTKVTSDGDAIAKKCMDEAEKANNLVANSELLSGMDNSHAMSKAISAYSKLASKMSGIASSWMQVVNDMKPLLGEFQAPMV